MPALLPEQSDDPVIPATGSRINTGLSLGSSMTQAASKNPRLQNPYSFS